MMGHQVVVTHNRISYRRRPTRLRAGPVVEVAHFSLRTPGIRPQTPPRGDNPHGGSRGRGNVTPDRPHPAVASK